VPHVHHVRVPQEFHNRQLSVFKSLILQNFFNRHGLVRRRAQGFVHDAERAVPDDALRFVTVVLKRKRERRGKKDVRGQRYVIYAFSSIDGQLSSPPFSSRLRCAFCISIIRRAKSSHTRRASRRKPETKKTARSVLLHLFISLYSVSLSHPSMTNEELLLSQLGKNLKKTGKKKREKKISFFCT